ncbi:alpha/beta hydrolase [Woodsholea maritima]|uniref:alpha/beta hydrolase n=1 Tax=Woodsholea maritima TaxID=240237 RepID=UPI0003660B4B|nr:alpha/beta hydrolase-fold protein [Woodsholea maritima]
MHIYKSLISLCIAAGMTLCGVAGWAQSPALVTKGPIVIGDQFEIASTHMNEARAVNVYLPAGYGEGDARYPVIYLLDGGVNMQDFHQITGIAELGALSAQIQQAIVVGVESKTRIYELTGPVTENIEFYNGRFPGNGGSAVFRAYLTEEVIPAIEANYRTNGQRILMGESLAGLFTVETALLQPEAFTDYLAVSPSLWWSDMALAKRADEILGDNYPEGRSIYLTIADEGGNMRIGMAYLVSALQDHEDAVTYWFEPRLDETHATIYHPAALTGLRKLIPPAPAEE